MRPPWKPAVAGMLLLAVAVAAPRAQNLPQSGAGQPAGSPVSSPPASEPRPQRDPGQSPVSQSGDPTAAGGRHPGFAPGGSHFAPVCFFAVPVAIVGMGLYFKHRRVKLLHDSLRAMLEKGVPMTPELIESLKPRDEGRGQGKCYLLAGLITCAAGIGVMINLGRPGWVPLLIGAAFLTAWLVERRGAGPDQTPGN